MMRQNPQGPSHPRIARGAIRNWRYIRDAGPREERLCFDLQYFAARGNAGVPANPRGSGGSGYTFQRANHPDRGTGPVRAIHRRLFEENCATTTDDGAPGLPTTSR